MFLQLHRQRDRITDVLLLGRLVSATEEDDQPVAAPGEVQPIARADVDAHLADAGTDRPHVAEVPEAGTINAGLNPGPSSTIAQSAEPPRKALGLPDLDDLAHCVL